MSALLFEPNDVLTDNSNYLRILHTEEDFIFVGARLVSLCPL